jgi:hypothetical protein
MDLCEQEVQDILAGSVGFAMHFRWSFINSLSRKNVVAN